MVKEHVYQTPMNSREDLEHRITVVCTYWVIVDKYGNYVRKFMWQMCRWGTVDICMTFHKRPFDFFYIVHIDLTIFKIVRL
jgi:hypothetical protein